MSNYRSFAGTMRSITELGLTLEGCRQLMSFPSDDPAMVQIRRIERKPGGKYEIEIFFPTLSMIETFEASPGQKAMTADEIAMVAVFEEHTEDPDFDESNESEEDEEDESEEVTDDNPLR